MRSLDESFWSVVGRWRSTTPKPVIVAEGGLPKTMPMFRGMVRDFVRGFSITFELEGGGEETILLGGCKVRTWTEPKPGAAPDDDLELNRFTLLCDEGAEGECGFTFTELRILGKPN